MLNDMFCLQILSLVTLFFFISTYNILTLWYLAGIYLVLLGSWLLLDDSDIFIGFLWVIDLGVGLVFFIFILHVSPVDIDYVSGFAKTWFFYLSWYDYYDFFYSYTITDLNLLREIYFYNNSFHFFLINGMLFYGIVSAILLCFLIKRIFSFLNYNQLVNYDMLSYTNATYFIRNQNFIKQQATSTGTRVWLKTKKISL